MDLTLNDRERAVLARVGEAIAQRSAADALDRDHWAALADAGLLEDPPAGHEGLLPAVLAVMEASRLGSLTPLGVATLVAPLFTGQPARGGIVAVADPVDPASRPVRYGAQADRLIRYDGARADLHAVDPGQARAAPSHYVYPLAIPATPAAPAMASGPAKAVLARHRLAIAAEAVGAMDSVLRRLCDYLTTRRQFGRPLGALQAVQHRLAELAIDLETARWLTYQAAFDDTAASAAVAAAQVARAARRFAFEVHQLAGARGFTLALGLSFDTLRLQAISIEAGGAKGHEADGFALIWDRGPDL
jgi:alkylation response protein AidB-like acyl-CoA dehydrogenase